MEWKRIGKLHKRVSLLLALAFSLCCTGCNERTSESLTRENDGIMKIGVSFPTTKLKYRQAMLQLLEEYARNCPETEEIVICDADGSQEKQNQDLLDMINAGVDGIILIPYTMEGELSMIHYANEQDIPVLTLDNMVTSSVHAKITGYVGADHEHMGQQAGELLIQSLETHFPEEDTWNVLYLTGVPNSSGAVDRDKGIRNVLKKDKRVNIIAEYNGEFTEEKAESIMEDCLLVYPNLHGVICQNDLMADGCCNALEAADRLGEIALVGIDGQRSVVERIAAGEIDGTVIQYPSMILDAVSRMEEDLSGTYTGSYHSFQETNPIDRGNAAEYLEQNLPY
ncbi:MAG: sugar ABC transporter substrate-binding protein [Clostridiales bacterium]|nr:sugar ABC transporter substrate-binding protein [Clostridiales bacterium]